MFAVSARLGAGLTVIQTLLTVAKVHLKAGDNRLAVWMPGAVIRHGLHSSLSIKVAL